MGSLSQVVREPDAVAWSDDGRLATANEGDWEGGSRGFTVFAADGSVLYDSGNELDHLGMRTGHYREDRAENKGVEPEAVEVGRFGDETLIFVGAERGNFVAVYRDGGPDAAPEFVQMLPTAIGPEGLLALQSRDLLVVASEADSEEDGYRAAIGIYARTADTPHYPQIVSAEDPATGAPIGWGALSGLAAGDEPNTLYAVSDSAYSVSRIYAIDASAEPARITGVVDLAMNGEPAAYDLEGIARRAGGGFWLASEGNPKSENPLTQRSLLLQVGDDGTVEREIALPEAMYAHATNRGFEGLATWGEGDAERVILAMQAGWQDDPENTTKLAIYSPSGDSWAFVRYPLEGPRASAAAGSASPRSSISATSASPSWSATTSREPTPRSRPSP
jgi:hypothetical protein